MTTSREFCRLLPEHGLDFFTGVPDSTFKRLLALLEGSAALDYVPAVSEDLAIGLAVGAGLGGRTPMVLMQNSGFAQSINALASLAWLYRIPMLLLIGWRGYRGRDAPEHLLVGEVLLDLLGALRIPYGVPGPEEVERELAKGVAAMREHRRPAALVLRQGILDADPNAERQDAAEPAR